MLPSLYSRMKMRESFEKIVPQMKLNESLRENYNTTMLTGGSRNYFNDRNNSYRTNPLSTSAYLRDKCASDLSSLTQIHNYIAKHDIDRYNRSTQDPHVSKNKDKDIASKLIRSATREIRCLSYKLSKVISDGNHHQVIEQNNWMGVEVIENIFIYCKVESKFKYCPAKVRIRNHTKNDLK